jgi:hypothetical protein
MPDELPPHYERSDTPRFGRSLGAPETIEHLRKKLQTVAADFAEGKLNRAQFNAIYAHYNEQRMLVEKLHQRNPDNDIWRQAVTPGNTGFLRTHFEARPVFYIVFRHHTPTPLMKGGVEPADAVRQIGSLIKTVWKMEKIPASGLARKAMGDGQWVVMALGEFALTVVVFSLQPSTKQHNHIRDLHRDFERANRYSLERNLTPAKMVFPQRGLLPQDKYP